MKEKSKEELEKEVEEWIANLPGPSDAPTEEEPRSLENIKMSDYSEHERMAMAKQNLDRILGDSIKGVPIMLTRKDIQMIFYLPKRAAYRFIRKHLVPLGAVIQVGNEYRIHPWGIALLLQQGKRCAYCGRGGPEIPGIPYYSTGDPKKLESLEKMTQEKAKKKPPVKDWREEY